jgi:hypothetical protein
MEIKIIFKNDAYSQFQHEMILVEGRIPFYNFSDLKNCKIKLDGKKSYAQKVHFQMSI